MGIEEYKDISSSIEPDYPTKESLIEELWEYDKVTMSLPQLVDMAEIGYKHQMMQTKTKEQIERQYYGLVGLGEEHEM